MIKGFLRATSLAAATALSTGVLAAPAQAVSFDLATNGGSGSGSVLLSYEDNFLLYLVGNDTRKTNVYTVLSSVATTASTVSGVFSYLTTDFGGSEFDPFGYFVGSVFTQLTADLTTPKLESGSFSFDVAAGETFGFYVLSKDGLFGAATAGVVGSLTAIPTAAVPLPAGGFLIIAALGSLAAVRRRKSV